MSNSVRRTSRSNANQQTSSVKRKANTNKTTASKESLDVKKGSGFQKGRSWLADYGVTVKGSFVVAKDKNGNKIYKHASTGEEFDPEAHGLSRSSSKGSNTTSRSGGKGRNTTSRSGGKGRSAAANKSSGSSGSNTSTRASNNKGKSSGATPRSADMNAASGASADNKASGKAENTVNPNNPVFDDAFQKNVPLLIGALGEPVNKAVLQEAMSAAKSGSAPANASEKVKALMATLTTEKLKKDAATTLQAMLNKYDQLTPTAEGLTTDGVQAAFKATQNTVAAATETDAATTAAAPRSANFVESGKPTAEQAANSLTQAETTELAALGQQRNPTPQQEQRRRELLYKMNVATNGLPPGTLSAQGANEIQRILSQQQAALSNPTGGLNTANNQFFVGNNNPLGNGLSSGLGTNTLGLNTLGMANPTLGGLTNTSNPFALAGMPNGLGTAGNNALGSNPLLANNNLQQSVMKLL